MTRLGRLILLAALIPAAAFADDKVDVMVQVVSASKNGNAIDPALASTKEWAKKFSYTAVKLISSQKVSVGKAAVEVKLPDNKVATLTLAEVKDGAGHVLVRTPNGTEAKFGLGRQGNSYQSAGKVGADDLWLILSPPAEGKPRRACGTVARPHSATAVLP